MIAAPCLGQRGELTQSIEGGQGEEDDDPDFTEE
jgi:hypothetical protein